VSDDETNNDEKPPTEGVRLIGADEAAEALGRDDVARRLTADDRKPGDRPAEQPYDGPPPTVSFPLSNMASPEDVPRPSLIDDRVDLPHWTEPATGEVPAVLRRDDDTETADDEWASFTGSAPRWRDSGDDFDDDLDDVRVLGHDAEQRLGALDDSDRPSDSDFFSFSDIDEPEQGRSVFAAAGDSGADDVDVYDDGAYYDDDEYDEYAEYDDEYDDAYDDEDDDPVVIGTARRTSADKVGRGPDSGGRNMGQAVGVGLVFAAVALALFAVGPVGGIVLVFAVVAMCGVEFFAAVQRAGYEPPTLVGVVAIPAMVLASYHRGEAAIPAVLFLTTVVGLVWYLVGAGGKRPTANLGVTLFGVLWIGMFGSFAALMLSAPDGVGLLIGAIIATVGYDVGGLFVGRNAGKYPLSAASPNKTWEGLIGGMIVAFVVAVFVAGFVPGFAPWDGGGAAIKLGLVVALAAPLGDLCQSVIKRDLGIKDMGTLLPGHGGLLDRFDALLFVLPSVYYLARVSDFFI